MIVMVLFQSTESLRLIVVLSLLCSGLVYGDKVCTNSGVKSHTARYQLSAAYNHSSWDYKKLVDLNFLPRGDDRAWSNSIPRKVLMEEDGTSGVRAGFLKEFSLHVVRLGSDSIQAVAQQTNLEYLLMLDVDRLVWSFRKTAGLETPGEPYGGWEAPNVELRGHFVGHYLSASALMWASTHNTDVKTKMSAVVSALSECQNKLGTGYLSAFPSELFDRFEALQEVWAPYYTIHKILAGLLDQYTLADDGRALNMAKWMVDYFYDRVQTVISKHTIERHWQSLNEETGGMNDVLYKLYTITGNEKHLLLAHLFDKPCFLGLLAMKADDISGFHANTHIPIVVGAQQRYEITGDPLYKDIGAFFMDIVNSSHSYATGGTSVSEFWYDPKRLATTLRTENEESCTTYNMLKVSRHLFRWTKDIAYADYYERALTNGVLGIQRGQDPGVMIYMLPLCPGGSKARSYHGWGTKFNSFWCCYGTGIESFSKLGDSIYFEEEGDKPGLYIVQYVSSSLDWKSGKILLKQSVRPVVSWDQRLRITVAISSRKQIKRTKSTLNFRIPHWAHSNGLKASLNDRTLPMPPPGNFLSITRSWKPGQDVIDLELHMRLRTESIKDDRVDSIRAFLYGPYLLAGLSSGDWDIKVDLDSISDSITPIPAKYNHDLITLSQEVNNSAYVLTNADHLIETACTPERGTDAAIRATFRLVAKNFNPICKLVMLEPFDYPGTLVHHHGEGRNLGVSDASSVADESSVFRLVPGLNGKEGTISLQAISRKGCYVYSDIANGLGTGVKLDCCWGEPDAAFAEATSFIREDGMYKYDPMSFVAKGIKRNFVMTPLYSLRDESYTVYFNTSI